MIKSKCSCDGTFTFFIHDNRMFAKRAFYYRIRVSKGGFQIFDCQIAQSRVCFVPLSQNKKN